MRVVIHPGAQRDANEIIAYYKREAGTTVVADFKAEMKRQISEIVKNPRRFSPYPPHPRWRRAFMDRFPHNILFEIPDTGCPRVLVIKHQKRHPAYGVRKR